MVLGDRDFCSTSDGFSIHYNGKNGKNHQYIPVAKYYPKLSSKCIVYYCALLRNQNFGYIPWSEDESLPSEGAGLTWKVGGVTGGLVSKSILDGAEKDAKRELGVELVVLEVAGVTLIEGAAESLVGHCTMGLLVVDESSGKREFVSRSSSEWRSFSGSPTRLQGPNLK